MKTRLLHRESLTLSSVDALHRSHNTRDVTGEVMMVTMSSQAMVAVSRASEEEARSALFNLRIPLKFSKLLCDSQLDFVGCMQSEEKLRISKKRECKTRLGSRHQYSWHQMALSIAPISRCYGYRQQRRL